MLLLSLYLLGKVNLAHPGRFTYSFALPGASWVGFETPLRTKFRLAPAVAVVCTLPLALSLWICCSRIHDNWHHPSDVIAGAFLGAFLAIFHYLLGFPHPWRSDSRVPLVSPLREDDDGPVKTAAVAVSGLSGHMSGTQRHGQRMDERHPLVELPGLVPSFRCESTYGGV
jgi:hypothetical protein